MGSVNIAVNQPSGRSLICYVHQVSTGFIYNVSEGSFVGDVLADIAIANRTPYRVSLQEAPAGTYRVTLDITNWVDGEYTFSVREESGQVEYQDILVEKHDIALGDIASTTIDFNIKTAEARSLFAYIQNLYDSSYLNIDTQSLAALDLVTATVAVRSQYRHTFIETAPGDYTLALNNTVPDGTYTLSTRELVGDVEIEAGTSITFKVRHGKRLAADRLDLVAVDHNTGGVDKLRYMTASGSPVGDALITVYLTSDISQGIYANPLATSSTDSTGRWKLPVSLESSGAGAYTIIFEKSGFFGPDSAEV